MKKLFIYVSFLFSFGINAQETTKTVDAKGTGIERNDALQDALRNAVSQAVGVVLASQTSVENYIVIQDAISTNTQGYIKSYDITSEKKLADGYEVNIKAVVTTSSMKADFNLLAKSVGGVRFMAVYDPRSIKASEKADYDYVLDQMNTYFASKKYRYIERARFLALQKEALLMMEESDTSGVSYAQQLALLADAQFIILVKSIGKEEKSEQFDTKKITKFAIDVVTYDNCTAEGLGTMSLESAPQSSNSDNYSNRAGIASAVKLQMDDLVGTFASYIGSWVNNGTPYELRFYGVGSYRDLRELKTKLKADAAFGGDLEIVASGNYTKINCTYKKKADEMADKVLDYADLVPVLQAKKLDVKLIFGRQISFAPQGQEIVKKTKVKDVLKDRDDNNKNLENTTDKEKKSIETTATVELNTTPGFTVFSEAGEKFWLVVNGTKINDLPLAKVVAGNISENSCKVKVIFQNNVLPAISDVLRTTDVNYARMHNTYMIKKNSKGKYSIKTTDYKIVIKGKSDDFFTKVDTAPTNVKVKIKECLQSMSEVDFLESKKSLESQFSSTREGLVRQIADNNCLTIKQIRELTSMITFDDAKLNFLKYAYGSCSERNKYYLINDVLSFSGYRDELTKFLSAQK